MTFRLLLLVVFAAITGSDVMTMAQEARKAAPASPITAEICIYGGTSAGVVAAVQARKLGKRVVLLEPGQHLGGMSVEGLGGTDVDNHPFQNSYAVGGLALEFYRRVSVAYGRQEQFDAMVRDRLKDTSLWRFEPHVAEGVFDNWVKEAGVTVYRGKRLADRNPVMKDGTRITSLLTASGLKVQAKVFIDATYEGDVLAAAGVTTTVGREGNAKYGETLNGIVTTTKHSQFEVKVDPYRVQGQPDSGLIFGVQGESVGMAGAGDHSVQAYCFRLCLTRDPEKRVPFAKPESYDASQYELQRRYVRAGGKLGKPLPGVTNGKTDPGAWHHLCGNMPGWNHEWSTASHAQRQKMLADSLRYIQGLCWFLANDPEVPRDVRDAWSAWGTCRDEFTDNAGWPRLFYVRNGRRMVSDFVLTEQHGSKLSTLPVEDPVALVWWPHDLHNARRIVKDGAVWNEGAVFGGNNWKPFGVAYRSLVPKAGECTNLLTPTCPSSSYVAYGAIRLEWTFMAMAHACATAASMAVDGEIPVQQVSYADLRQSLAKDGQIMEVPADAPAGNSDGKKPVPRSDSPKAKEQTAQ